MKCLITPKFPPTIQNEAGGVNIRTDVLVVTGTNINVERSIEVVVPFASSSTQMTNTIKSAVQSELLRLDGINVATADIFVFSATLS